MTPLVRVATARGLDAPSLRSRVRALRTGSDAGVSVGLP